MILEAAARVLERKGLEGFNTNAVAEAAGVSIGSLYQYFPNKDSLTLALIQLFEQELHAAYLQAVEETEGASLEETFRALVKHQYRVHHRRPALHRLLEAEEDRLRPEEPADEDAVEETLLRRLHLHRKSPRAQRVEEIADIFTISRAMIDETLREGATEAAVVRRTMRALQGYL
ncbi:TetR/AcrR family transcriptional regulator [Granulicella cerasi]|uniref:TetR/AcrR family transcriptional regulator n=1 Tax=Granulicella cerasi TaxID=741063 RepID=A0ABW1ZAU2_9BACT|nr:TetR/AcrR family transcriptional regulator [Granulicella cerasi]